MENRDKPPYKPNVVFRKEVLYDINSLPTADLGTDTEKVFRTVMEHYKDSGILLYDASVGIAPIFTEKELKR
jgi:hypothetical protein